MWRWLLPERSPTFTELTQPNPKCPYCRAWLRTPKAKQCASCLMDWHDPKNPFRRKRVPRSLQYRLKKFKSRSKDAFRLVGRLMWQSLQLPYHYLASIRNCRAVCRTFDGTKGIYVEKGVLFVQISNVRADMRNRLISLVIEEIPTAGIRHPIHRLKESPLSFEIAAGLESLFSKDRLSAGYPATWSLYTNPRLIDDVLNLASTFPDNMGAVERYNQILPIVHDPQWYIHRSRRIFPGERIGDHLRGRGKLIPLGQGTMWSSYGR